MRSIHDIDTFKKPIKCIVYFFISKYVEFCISIIVMNYEVVSFMAVYTITSAFLNS